ncbi:MAG: MFS transporter, partial [Clostridia bacterium]|nr:MFS transporter [Clostridia bacterium]
MKLNYKRVMLVGMAFFLISAFWQAYDAIVPLILTNHFGMPQTASGAVMSLDNVLAVFMLPIFGALSDKTNTRFGKRTPFIFCGTIVAVISFVCLTLIDNYQLAKVNAAGFLAVEGDAAEALQKLTWELTLTNIWPLVGFIATLLVVL